MEHIKFLLDNNFPMEIASPDSIYPIHLAAQTGNKEIVKLFISKGCDINSLTLDNITPLHFAVESGNYETIKILLENGAKIRADDLKRTPMSIAKAIDCPDKERIQILINETYEEKIGEKYIKDDEKFIAYCSQKPELVKKYGGRYIILAAKYNMPKIIMFLIKNGVDVNSFDNKSKLTPLHLCAQNNNESLVSFLIQNGALLTEAINGKTALDMATDEMVKLMLKIKFEGFEVGCDVACAALKNNKIPLLLVILESQNFDINSYNEKGKTLLTTAVSMCNRPIVKAILSYDPDLSKVTRNGLSPLHISVIKNDIEITKELIKHCAPILVDNFGKDPTDYATTQEMKELLQDYEYLTEETQKYTDKDHIKSIVKEYKSCSPIFGPMLAFSSIRCQSEHSLKFLLSHGVQANCMDQNGNSLLHYAASIDNLQAAILLLQNRADVNIRNREKATPLHIACVKGNYLIVDLLLSNGADINAVAKGGMTPLMYSARQGIRKIVNLLIENGADETLKNSKGQTYKDLSSFNS